MDKIRIKYASHGKYHIENFGIFSRKELSQIIWSSATIDLTRKYKKTWHVVTEFNCTKGAFQKLIDDKYKKDLIEKLDLLLK